MLMLQHQDGSRACDFPFLIDVACLFTSVLDTDSCRQPLFLFYDTPARTGLEENEGGWVIPKQSEHSGSLFSLQRSFSAIVSQNLLGGDG
jgi:hypothetical protein